MQPLISESELFEQVQTYRRELHQIPEIGFDLPLTSAYIKEKLITFGYEPIPVAQTGWIAVKKGRHREAIAFRSDMDGLEVTEVTGAAFASRQPGRMHACGHDGHMALLLGFARYCAALPQPEKTLVFVFQPAEEGPGGARVIVESGILDELNVQKIYGYHLFPDLPEGRFGLAAGPLMARNGEVYVTITGTSSHAGQPHLGQDVLMAAAQFLLAIQTIISRRIDPLQPAVLNIGTLHAGEAMNIVAGKAEMSGTIRSYDKATYETIKAQLEAAARGVELTYQVTCEVRVIDFYPEVRNDPEMIGLVQSVLEPGEYQLMKPLMLAEDFAFYQEKYPGAFLLLGTGRPDKGWTYPLHSGSFQFDEGVLLKGIALYRKILRAEGIDN